MGRTIAVTGAAGFLGRALLPRLAREGWTVRAITRDRRPLPGASETCVAGDLLTADLPRLVGGCDTVINCAARVHVTKREDANLAEREYRRMNSDFPVALARAAKVEGATHFIQISSVAAIATQTATGECADDNTVPRPSTPYGRSKLVADQRLAELAGNGLDLISLRPPALYGPGVEAWFALLARAARVGLPLPIGRISNARSFAFVGNLADAVSRAVQRELSGTFVVTDSEPISSTILYRKLLRCYGHGDRTWRWPPRVVNAAARFALGGRSESLLGNAAFSGSRFSRTFGWHAPTTMDEALMLTATRSLQV